MNRAVLFLAALLISFAAEAQVSSTYTINHGLCVKTTATSGPGVSIYSKDCGGIPLLSLNNLNDLLSPSTARTNLGLAIGTNVEAWNTTLDAIAAGTWAGSASLTTLGTIATGTWHGTAITDTYISSASTWNAKLGTSAIGVSVEAWDADLDAIAALTSPATLISGAAQKTNNLSDLASASTARSNLGLVIGTNVEAFDADLNAIAAISTTGVLRRTGTNTWDTLTTATDIGVGTLTGSNIVAAPLLGVLTGGGTYDFRIADPETNTAIRTLSFTLNNVNRQINLGGNIVTTGNFSTSGAFNFTGTLTANTGVTFPTSGTLCNTATCLLGSNNLSDVVSASTARTNLGLAIGTNVEAWDADLDALAALSATAGIVKRTGAGTFGLAVAKTDFAPATSGSAALLGDGLGGFSNYAGTSCTNQFLRSLSTAIAGTCASVQNADLAGSIAASKLVGTDINTLGTITSGVWNGTAVADTYISSAAVWNAKLGTSSIGSTVEAWDADLDCLAALSSTGILKKTGAGTCGIAASSTDYAPATSGSAILKGNGTGGFSSAVAKTDYAPATSGSVALLGDGLGGFSNFAGATCTNQFVRILSNALAATCASVANADLVNSSVTINTHSLSLGASLTLAFSDFSGTVSASQLPTPTTSSLGGVNAIAAVANRFLTNLTVGGSFGFAQVTGAGLVANPIFPGHVSYSGTAPTASSCGTSPGSPSGTDTNGKVTTGTSTATCTITFNVAYAAAPRCFVMDNTGWQTIHSAETTTTLIVTAQTALGGDEIRWYCTGN